MNKFKLTFLSMGLLWSAAIISLHTLKRVDMADQRDFYLAVMVSCGAGLGIQKRTVTTPEEPPTKESDE